MNSLQKYNQIFIKVFGVKENELEDLEYQSVEAWDSVGQMELVAELEDEFGIMLDTDDMLSLSSYKLGKEILHKYAVEL